MKITKIDLLNWCQYEGDHRLEFGSDSQRNVILVHADNDVGKSSLFSSIRWCLHEARPEKWVRKNWPLYPLTWYQRAKPGDQLKTQVSVTFEHDGTRYCASRWFTTQKTKADPVECDKRFLLQKSDRKGNWSEELEARLYRIFPRSILGYFLFDAETIEHFANDGENVKNSVLRLLNIEDAERGLDHLAQVTDALQREFKRKKNNKVDELNGRLASLSKQIETLAKTLNDDEMGLKAQQKQAREERKAVEKQLYEFKPIHSLLQREKQIDQQILDKEDDRIEILKHLRDTTRGLYLVLAAPVVSKSRSFLDEQRKKGQLPKHIKKAFIDERVKLGQCICGTSLTPGSDAHKQVCGFAESLSDELSENAVRMNADLRAATERSAGLQQPLNVYLKSVATLEDELRFLEEDRSTVRSKIQSRKDIPDVPALESKKEALDRKDHDLGSRIHQLHTDIEDKRKERENLENDLGAELSKEKQGNQAERQWVLANTAQRTLANALTSFKKKARAYLEKQCNLLGKELFWRDEVYTIHINEEYTITARSPLYGDRDLMAGMSMGATQMTGLALICALAKQTQARVPLIMDTPFARLSPAHITRALRECPNHFEQWILFLQPSEWKDSEYRKALSGALQKEYTLERQGKSAQHVTKLHEGYQPEYFAKSKGER